MNKTEAINLMMKGKKVRMPEWSEDGYIYYDKNRHIFLGSLGNLVNTNCELDDEWEEYVHKITFLEALEHLKISTKNTVLSNDCEFRLKDNRIEYKYIGSDDYEDWIVCTEPVNAIFDYLYTIGVDADEERGEI